MKQNNLTDLFSLITEVRRKNASIISSMVKKYNLTHEQWVVLRTIVNNNFSTQKEIANLTHKSKSTLTRILDQLEQKNLIKRQVNEGDRRLTVLVGTQEGKTIVKEFIPVEEEVKARIRDGISEEDVIDANTVFLKMLGNIEEIIRG